MTYIGKITHSEAVQISRKSSDFTPFYAKNQGAMMQKLIDAMEDDDDVQNVWHNWEE